VRSLLLLFFLSVLSAPTLPAQDAVLPTLTTARELRELPLEDAARKYPVRLRGVVTLNASEGTIFIQDETGGTYIHAQKTNFTAEPGQQVEVEGVTYRGLYLTGVVPATLHVLGRAPLPTPRAVNYEQLASGIFNYEWVEVRGTVRAFRADEDRRGVLTLGMGNGRLEILTNRANPPEAEKLIDAAVRVTGLAAGFINDKRQLVAPHLRIDTLAAFEVEQPAPEDPFALPVTPAAELLQFTSTATPGHRVKVRGIVTHHEPGRALFLRDGGQGLLVDGSSTEPRQPGDLVEAAGFAEMGAYSAQLRDAVWRVIERGPEAEAAPIKASQIEQGAHDADLVQIEAELLDVRRADAELFLVLRAGENSFRARITEVDAAALAALRAGSLLRLTGVLLVEQPEFAAMRFGARPHSFTLLLRSAGDVAVLHQPPWWTAGRLAAALGAVLAVAGAALAWVVALRRRVTAQTAIIREKIAAEAALEERERIAREFHDTLEQELVGLALRLDAATTKVAEPKPRELLESARRLVQNIQSEARNLMSNLRARTLDDAPLPEAIDRAMTSLRHERRIEVHTGGEQRRLAGVIEHELLRIAQEAATNAVKHGQAARIDIALTFTNHEVRLRVTDDGRGFDVERDGTKPGHFGLIGIRERVQKLGGHCTLHSQPGAGATLEATVPLPPS
jgi:signal transduction histidine kinase